jgi:hypothetical protein
MIKEIDYRQNTMKRHGFLADFRKAFFEGFGFFFRGPAHGSS